ncbi:MAG: Ig-like domain-containing protein [Clostridia bacterium]|nr:Ig-like domain-containing protein [Clostridia bacterium]
MTVKRIISLLIAALFFAALFPVCSFAEGSVFRERRLLRRLDEAWTYLDAVEFAAVTAGMDKSAVTLSVMRAAAASGFADTGSLSSVTSKSFFFKVEGLYCAYDYDARNYEKADRAFSYENKKDLGPEILLVGPYYGQDASFTDRYVNEAESVAETAEGHTRVISGADASGPAIAGACAEARVVFFDSHGVQSGDSTYLCLITAEGITADDYMNGWAVSAGASAYIDGRYILNHAPYPLDDCFIWMSFCSGMHALGNGVTGYALLSAGASGVYGYSQDVSFAGDYVFEEHFWNSIKTGSTVAEAFSQMTAEAGEYDPFSSPHAWPVVMSPVDAFPQDPDSHQTVNCGWTLKKTETAIAGWSLSETDAKLDPGEELKLLFVSEPADANAFSLVWSSGNDEVAAVSGNDRGALVTAVSPGKTRIVCEIRDPDGDTVGTEYCEVSVRATPDLLTALNVPGARLPFTTGGEHPWTSLLTDGRTAAASGNFGVRNSASSLSLTLDMQAGDTLSFDWKVSSEPGDKLGFFVNGELYGNTISGIKDWSEVVYIAASDGQYAFEWRYQKDRMADGGEDRGYVDNVFFSGTYELLPGDFDCDGAISASDALVILRIALDIIECPDWFDGDLDGDGELTAADALIALRIALGIIPTAQSNDLHIE